MADDARQRTLASLRGEQDPSLHIHRRNLSMSRQLARRVTGQFDPAVLPFRLYADFSLSASGKIVTIVPRESQLISLYGDNGWTDVVLPASITLDFTSATSGKKHDIFLYPDNSATATLADSVQVAAEFLAWTSETARATGLTATDGVYLKTGDNTRRWIGTAYYDGTLVYVAGGIDPLMGAFYGSGDPNDIAGTSPTGSGMQNPGILVNSVRYDIFSLVNGALRFGVSAVNALLAIGSNIAAAATTSFAVFGTAQTYNGESMAAGALLLGDNSAGKANILFSAGVISFRIGTTVVANLTANNTLYVSGGVNIFYYLNFK